MAELTPLFSSNRMLREYVEKLYLPALSTYNERSKKKAAKSVSLYNFKKTFKENFQKIYFGKSDYTIQDSQYLYKIPVYLEGIEPDNIVVQLYAEPQNGETPEIYNMTRDEQKGNEKNEFLFKVQLPSHRKISDYTPRIIPLFEGAIKPLELKQILWKD